MPSDDVFVREVIREAVDCLDSGMEKIDHCLAQLDDAQVWWRPQEEMNAIGNLLLHLAGNLRQWIVAGVGDADDIRDRPGEFAERRSIAKDELLQGLQDVVTQSCSTLTNMSAEQLLVSKRVQGGEVTKLHAMMHSVNHFQGHVQEIISLTRQQLGNAYQFHWAPKTVEEGAS